MVVINSLNGKGMIFVRRINHWVLGLLYGFFKSLLELLHLLLLGPQFIVELDVLSLLLSKFLLNNNYLLFHKPSLLVAHALLLKLLDLVSKLLSARSQLFLLRCKSEHLLLEGSILALEVPDHAHQRQRGLLVT